jgi:hypothetical protein
MTPRPSKRPAGASSGVYNRAEMPLRFRYSRWNGTQQINPLDAGELLDLLADDLLDEGVSPLTACSCMARSRRSFSKWLLT